MVLPNTACDTDPFNLRRLLYKKASFYTPNERLRMQIVETTISLLIDQVDQFEIKGTDNLISETVHRIGVQTIRSSDYTPLNSMQTAIENSLPKHRIVE
ncbi:hypothetical protein [Ochrobactrum sp. MYb379]|jgi:hypothetical protein|uniref:hypothetical protein n=1 Tax=Ochrobactrum sp. MYb379 TaxID=2745275 RepID=UPI0030A71C0B